MSNADSPACERPKCGGRDVVESPAAGEYVTPEGTDPVDVRELTEGVTWDEWHAFAVGLSLTLIATATTVAGIVIEWPEIRGLAVVMVGSVASLTLVAFGRRKVGNEKLRYIVREPHYYLGGVLAAFVFATVATFALLAAATVGGWI